jgi:eukaryotic-like serine/threonine-protein kinase
MSVQVALTDTPVVAGELVAGKYRVERLIGQGGMGVVVAAVHVELEEPVAIKFLLPAVRGRPNVIARFLREARAAARIKNEHVARVTDVGTLENGAPYLVMEYLKGNDLATELRRKGRFAVRDAVDYVLQAAEAIAEAHSIGIVHRDIKPANLFLTRLPGGVPVVKVLDFGIAKSLDDDAALTLSHAVLGSSAYMSPEQIRSSRDTDPRADVWALGVVLYELLTGHLPFERRSLGEVAAAITHQPPTPIEELLADVPPEVSSSITWCLQKNRAERCPSVAALADALVAFGSRSARTSRQRISLALGEGPPSLQSSPPSTDDVPLAQAPTLVVTPAVSPSVAPDGSNPPGGSPGTGERSWRVAVACAFVSAALLVGSILVWKALRR